MAPTRTVERMPVSLYHDLNTPAAFMCERSHVQDAMLEGGAMVVEEAAVNDGAHEGKGHRLIFSAEATSSVYLVSMSISRFGLRAPVDSGRRVVYRDLSEGRGVHLGVKLDELHIRERSFGTNLSLRNDISVRAEDKR